MKNQYQCRQVGANTGFGDCTLDIGKVSGFFLVGQDFKIPASAMATAATLMAFLLAAASADSKDARIYPVHQLLDVTDNSEDDVTQTYGYGPSVTVREGYYGWEFPFRKGGICLLLSLQQFNGDGKRVIFYDDNWLLFGYSEGEDLAGIPLNEFYAPKWGAATGAAKSNLRVKFGFAPRYINKGLAYVKFDAFNPELIKGLRNINLKLFSAAKPVYKVNLFTGCNAANLFDTFPTEFAAVPLWIATNAATGAVITITSVAADPNAKAYTVTLDSTDPDYPAVGSINLTLAAPSVLKAAQIPGFEGSTLEIVNI